MGYGFEYDAFSGVFFIMFFIFIVIFIMDMIKGVSKWSHNNSQPVLAVDCEIVSKRTNTSHLAGHIDTNGHHHSGTSSTTYYITFEFESRDRMEFRVSGKEYGMIAEGDVGKLKFQGSSTKKRRYNSYIFA